jgi:hypothetical protein
MQVPMSYEDSVALVERWRRARPALTATAVLGVSLGGRELVRLEVTDSGRRGCY